MILAVLAYLAGVLTIVSPCILPVLPFVFARAGRPFAKSILPMLLGMALTFAFVASLAALAGGWAVDANRYGRLAAMLLLALFGCALLVPTFAAWIMRPFVRWGEQLSGWERNGGRSEVASSLILGVATGFLWAPCAGPVLGLILTGAALQGATAQTYSLLVAYAAGAATSLALALLVGGRIFALMKRSLGAGEWIRRGLGAAVLAAVAAISLGLDTGFLTRISFASTAALEESLIKRLDHAADAEDSPSVVMDGDPAMMMSGNGAMMQSSDTMMAGNSAMMMSKGTQKTDGALPNEGNFPPLSGAVDWINSSPLSTESLRGKVVLIDFWTYSCINCLRAIPYVQAWQKKYAAQEFVVIGVHTPEFAFEKDLANVRKAVADLGISYPVAVDNDYAVWRAFKNRYWPAHYFIDSQGRIRHHHFGEGSYDTSERVIQALLAEANSGSPTSDLVAVNATGAQAASDSGSVLSPETYIGFDRAENFISPGGIVENVSHTYENGDPRLNEWSLAGKWTVSNEHASLDNGTGSITYRFHARDLHLVLGPAPDGKSIRFIITVDGKPPGDSHGVDVASDGSGQVTDQRLYQLIRQSGEIKDRTFEIKFLDPHVQAYAFTFG